MRKQFTQGDWMYYETHEGFEVVQNIHQYPIPTRTAIVPYNDAEGEANAKLIATAPEMLRELASLYDAIALVSTGYPPVDYQLEQWRERVKVLIKKATE